MTATALALPLLALLAAASPADDPAALVADAPGAHTTYAYDDSQPTITCAPLLVCDIALETGEVISDFATGNSKDWFVQNFTAGPLHTPHVVIKPQSYDLATNLIVATDRRTYHFHLVSPSEAAARAKGFRYDRLVSFSYPAATLQHLPADPAIAAAVVPALPRSERCADPTCWSFRYRIGSGRWAPLRVLDDGAHVYIQLSSHEAPALFEVLPDKSTAPLNYRFSGDSRWIIVDKLFQSARLVLRAAHREMATSIERLTSR